MRVLCERVETAVLLSALLIQPATGAAEEAPEERGRFEEHVRHLTAEGGEWIADNADYREALEAGWVPYRRGERGREEALAALTSAVAPTPSE